METKIVFDALEKFIKGRARLEKGNYYSPWDQGARLAQGVAAYRAESRSITKDRHEALAALTEARSLAPRYDVLMDAFRAFSGRLTWVPAVAPCDWCPTGAPAHLEYCTGQYYPTEYRKAARAVLTSYISGCKAATAKEQPREYVYNSIEDVRRANADSGGHWFEKATMRFFNCRIETGIVKCGSVGEGAAHRFTKARFITSEKGPHDSRRSYSIREAQPGGDIKTIGDFQGYATLRAAKAAILTEGK